MNVLLGVSGSIAAYKACDLVRLFIKAGHQVRVCLTPNAHHFVAPMALETLSGYNVYDDEFVRGNKNTVEHIEYVKWCDLFLVAPASANVIAKMANGVADNPVNTLYLACRKPVLIAPAMNSAMLDHPATRRNLDSLIEDGAELVAPSCGWLACGDEGKGKLAPLQDIFAHSAKLLDKRNDFSGRKVLVTAGPTREPLDPVRYVSNHSSGKMGWSLANALYQRGAEVTLVSGPVHLDPPYGITKISVETADQMYSTVTQLQANQDLIIMAAAVADFSPANPYSIKWKKTQDITVPEFQFTTNQDILAHLCQHRPSGQYIVGFAAETCDVSRNAQAKLKRKGADMIVANLVAGKNKGFTVDTNRVELFTPQGRLTESAGTKDQVAHDILDQVVQQCQDLWIR
ncbi:bifunctional phosphopantothenoylcysteine decarboxylase/phosphopantothenate--cysteine ligase CoaBC [Desulfurispira natronophila]|uniref:Coenzyme A biosynthesis bifunctional protein CoaBC n=1 Tax=Desulfurispira natronophila TaxID=682562 RepID=A0A7W7Y2S9_9BACT|nr:bifunctional phosphopantothenoylcysteine decarboxylase/phosphopantothenate--cysteine ligase CoaBC [Desulfurispira natronophila]MBB5021022.1 phosphopantothenoylcysteine decarboxylase/phosphopantothenate--cysteine ligase [Desulfurispira natronophila]